MSVTHLIASAMSAPLALLASAAPATAHAVIESTAASAAAFTLGRSWSVVAVLLGLTGAIVGGRALTRSPDRCNIGRGRGGMVALVTGLIGAGAGGLVVVAADGAPVPAPGSSEVFWLW